jgi:signal transduction histidine kinase
VSLDDVVGDAVRAVRGAAAAAGVAVNIRQTAGAWRALCDVRHFSAALKELLHNAIAHSAPDSEVEVAIDGSAGEACVTVSDRGGGMEAEMLRRCREPFRQGAAHLTRTGGGLGLGLPLAQRILELHGGTLELTSEPGAGTRAVAVVPLADSARECRAA